MTLILIDYKFNRKVEETYHFNDNIKGPEFKFLVVNTEQYWLF